MKKILAALSVVAVVFMLSASTVIAQPAPCAADLNCDGDVAGEDITLFLSELNKRLSISGNPCTCVDSSCSCAVPVQWCYSSSECQGVGNCCCVNYYFPEQGGWCLDADNCDDHLNAFICW